jgi:hypothetical protein
LIAVIVRTLAGIGAAALLAAAPATAASPTPVAPQELPGLAGAASTQTWIVGARPSARARAIARRHGARRIIGGGTFVVPRGRARELAAALGADLVWSEADRPRRMRQGPPASEPYPAPWRDQVVAPGLEPPVVTAASPLIGIVDSPADLSHPEFTDSGVAGAGGRAVTDLHGTATAAVAAAPRNGRGMLGLWPGARALNVPLPPQPFGCADSALGIRRAVDAGAAVINMSYGSQSFCFSEYLQLQLATARGISLVAAAGNEFAQGNPLEFPGGMPHVITVAAVGPDLKTSYFSNQNAAIDLAAPGESIVTAVPPGLDEDSVKDGYMALDGTSFAAPMVAAATAWVRARRPSLSVDQVAQVVRLSARDLGRKGWDPDSGFGLLDVGAALTRAAPSVDPREPNDEILWVDGRAFGRADRAVSTRGRAATFRALLDRYEDPADVYRVVLPRRSALRVSVKPSFGDPDLAVFSRGARDLGDARRVLGSSTRNGSATDSVVVTNAGRATKSVYVGVAIDRSARSLDAGYTLTVRRAKRR